MPAQSGGGRNPLLDGLRIEPTPGPTTVVIFGASGDLTRRKLLPALYHLSRGQRLPTRFNVIGVARSPMSDDQFRDYLHASLKEFAGVDTPNDVSNGLARSMTYMHGELDDPDLYKRLCEKTSGDSAPDGVLFYLAIPPTVYATVVEWLGRSGLTKPRTDVGWRRVIVEKPFGTDLATARELNALMHRHMDESQIFRIDHYLGKETVQNLLVFRFANGMFEPIWNRRYIDHVQITVSEELGVEARGPYYDTAGAMRDMVPNHIAQLLSLVGMEPPISFSADAVRDEQVKLLKSIEPLTPEEVLQQAVRGQYGPGEIDGKKVPGYREEEKVPPESNTETFVALRFMVDNWRWAGVPFYARTGKRLPTRMTQIVIQFKHAPAMLFQHTSVDRLTTNRLYIHIQPKEGISLRFGAKVPGPVLTMGAVEMDFDYVDYFGKVPSTGYETLLYDAMIGDATLFQRADMVEAGWAMVQPILDVWKALPPRSFPNYPSGSWGPHEADELLRRDGRHWENSGT